MKYSLLELTQTILSEMSSDEVNSISDTAESLQVANIIRSKYFDIVSRAKLPDSTQLIQLEPSLNALQPTLMVIPDGVVSIDWIKYFNSNILDGTGPSDGHDVNTDISSSIWTTTSVTSNTIGIGAKTFTVATGLVIHTGDPALAVSGVNQMSGTVTSYTGSTLVLNITSIIGSGTFTAWTISKIAGLLAPPGYADVQILSVRQFLDYTNGFNPADSNVQTMFSPAGYTVYYMNDRQPTCCAIFGNSSIIFDSYDNTQDVTLQSVKTECYGQTVPVFNLVDTFVPKLDHQEFPLLLNEAKALAFYVLKQQPHQLAMQETKRQWSSVSKNKSVINRPSYFDELANFGRLGGSLYSTRGFNNDGNLRGING